MSVDENVLLLQSKVNLVQYEKPILIANNNQTKQVNTILFKLVLGTVKYFSQDHK